MRQPYPNELMHYGILGMKWGIRRYQNADGTYTEAGKKRYAKDLVKNAKAYKKQQEKEDRIWRKTGKRVDLNEVDQPGRDRQTGEIFRKNAEDFYKMAVQEEKLFDEAIAIRTRIEQTEEYRDFKKKIEPSGLVDSDDEVFDAYERKYSNSKDVIRLNEIRKGFNDLTMQRAILAEKITDDYLGKYGDRKAPDAYLIGNRPVKDYVSAELQRLGSSILRNSNYKMRYLREKEMEEDNRALNAAKTELQNNSKMSSKMTAERYRDLNKSLSELGGTKYDNLPLAIRQKLISDYNKETPADEAPGGKDYSFSYRPNKETKYQSAKDYYDRYMAWHPNSELTFSEFKQWNIVND